MDSFLQLLRECLDQCREMVGEIHDPEGRKIIEAHIRQLGIDIAKLELFGRTQAKIQTQTQPTPAGDGFVRAENGNGAKCRTTGEEGAI